MPRSNPVARASALEAGDSSAPHAGGHQSPAELAARRANLLKACAAPRERIYRPTEKRRAASRRNLARAQAALRTRRGGRSPRMNALKHGLFAREFSPAALGRLGEDPQEYKAMLRLFRRVFVPRERPERELVDRLAQTCWRRLRLFRAQARREQDSLRKALASIPAVRRPLSVEETELRAHLLGVALFDLSRAMDEGLKLQSQIECLLRALLRKRSAGTLEFRMLSPRRESLIAQVESLPLQKTPLAEMTDEELAERLRYFRFDQLTDRASRQSAEQEARELSELLAAL